MYSVFDASHTFQTGFNRSNNIKEAKKKRDSIKMEMVKWTSLEC